MPLAEPRLLPWPAAAAGLDAAARMRHLVAGALRTGRPLAAWREPGAEHPQLLVARSLEAAYTGLPPALDAEAPACSSISFCRQMASWGRVPGTRGCVPASAMV